MIDITIETVEALELAGRFLFDHAALRRASASATAPNTEETDDDDTQTSFFPPVPTSAVPTAPAASNAPVSTAAPSAPTFAPQVLTGPGNDEYDSSGIPWDGRIHQKHKSKKKDGTWKLQKGIADSLVEAIMRELTPRIRHVPTIVHTTAGPVLPPVPTPNTVGASAPVPLPPIPVGATNPYANTAPPAPIEQAQAYSPHLGFPPIPTTAQAPTAPPAPVQDATPGAQGPNADPFRALVTKITNARNEKRIAPEEITACVTGAGAPSLQLLNNMPHLIPTVEASIDAILATR